MSTHAVEIAGTIAHEDAHVEIEAHGEPPGYTAQILFYQKSYRNGLITKTEYDQLTKWILENAAGPHGCCFAVEIVARSLFMPLAMAWMPEMHQHVDLASLIYRQVATPFIQGLWGIQVNSTGPAAPKTPPR